MSEARPCGCRRASTPGRSSHQFVQITVGAGTERNSSEEWFLGVCDVCVILDRDSSEKNVRYCHICDANVCLPCRSRWSRRVKAALMKRRIVRNRKNRV